LMTWQLGPVNSSYGTATTAGIYRSTTSGSTALLVYVTLTSLPACPSGSPTGAYCYVDTSVALHTTYYYQITSKNSSGESAKSSQSTAVIP
jgi:hypothetical protein